MRERSKSAIGDGRSHQNDSMENASSEAEH